MIAEPPGLQATFRALADPTRRGIISLLGSREMTVAEVAGHFDMTRAAVKKHLTVLEEGQIVTSEQHGRERRNRLEPMALKSIADWLNHFEHYWDDRLAALRDAIDAEKDKPHD